MEKIKAIWAAYRCRMVRPAVSVSVGVLTCLLLPYFYGCFCEFVRTASVFYLLQYLEAHILQIFFGAVVTSLLFALVMLLTARPWVANLTVGGVLCLASWVNLQKLIYRGDPLLPKDLIQASAAAGIAGELTFSIGRETILFALFLLLSTLLLLPVRLPFGKNRRGWLARTGLTLVTAAALPLYFALVLYNKPLMRAHRIGASIASLADAYYRGSFVTSFCAMSADLFPIQPPTGYNEAAVKQALAAVQPQSGGEQRECDVIVVLLESYFFLDNYDTAVFSEPLTENFRRIAAEGISGQMLSEGYGGGTANIEFSVLTGYRNQYLPTGSTPYMEYIKDGFLCYPQFLKARGYQTLALHPYITTFYNRNHAYPQMGIDTFVTQEAFTDADRLGNYVSEQATFTKALDLYREAAQTGPVFLHIVTMQNHIPNQPEEYAPEHQVSAVIAGENEYYNGCLTSVATTLRDIDHALGAFVDALREENRDIVVLFFGDHQTNVNGDEGEDLLSHMAAYNALDSREQTLRSHVTPYLMWANFDVGTQGTDGGLLPSHMLLPVLLNAYNVVRPVWMDWLLATEPVLGELDYDLHFADREALLANMTEEQKTVYHAQELLQYDLMFGAQYAGGTLYQ